MAIGLFGHATLFADRRDAGRRLAQAAAAYAIEAPLILALPRGGVPVAFEVAQALDAPLDLLFVRKIGAPGHPEYGIGAVVDGDDPQIVLNEDADRLGITAAYLEQQKRREMDEIMRRRRTYLRGRAPAPVKGRVVMVVDDGIATGGTMRASLLALRLAGARHLILAVPVAPHDAIARLKTDADETLCLATPRPFHAVGLHYDDFTQTTDAEVIELLDRSRPG